MLEAQINLDGLSDDERQMLLLSYEDLRKNADVRVVSDEDEIQGLVDRFSDANIDLYEGGTCFQNVFFVNDDYYLIQIKMRGYIHQSQRGATISMEYLFELAAYKELDYDYDKIVLQPHTKESYRVSSLLNRLFHSDEMSLDGHKAFNEKNNLTATNKDSAIQLFSDASINAISASSETHVVVVKDALIVWLPQINEGTTNAINNIVSSFKGK